MKVLDVFKNWPDVVEVSAGAKIFAELEEGEHMFVVITGEVELTKQGEPLGAELPGGIIGEMAIIGSGAPLRSATATALQPSSLARVDRDQFLSLIGENPEFALHVMQVLANRLKVANMLRLS